MTPMLTPSDTFGLGILGVLGAFLSLLFSGPYLDRAYQQIKRWMGRSAL